MNSIEPIAPDSFERDTYREDVLALPTHAIVGGMLATTLLLSSSGLTAADAHELTRPAAEQQFDFDLRQPEILPIEVTVTHEVIEDETIYGIAKIYGVDTEDLGYLGTPELLQIGQGLKFKVKNPYVIELTQSDSIRAVSRQTGIPASVLRKVNQTDDDLLSGPIVIPKQSKALYKVKAGDNLTNIAAEYGLSIEDIANSNLIPEPDLIYPNQRLIIPKKPKLTTISDGESLVDAVGIGKVILPEADVVTKKAHTKLQNAKQNLREPHNKPQNSPKHLYNSGSPVGNTDNKHQNTPIIPQKHNGSSRSLENIKTDGIICYDYAQENCQDDIAIETERILDKVNLSPEGFLKSALSINKAYVGAFGESSLISPEFFVFHWTAGRTSSTQEFVDGIASREGSCCSVQYFIDRQNAETFQFYEKSNAYAVHAGNDNYRAIGVEIEAIDFSDYTSRQIEQASYLALRVAYEHELPIERKSFRSHSEISPDGKIDPPPQFIDELFAHIKKLHRDIQKIDDQSTVERRHLINPVIQANDVPPSRVVALINNYIEKTEGEKYEPRHARTAGKGQEIAIGNKQRTEREDIAQQSQRSRDNRTVMGIESMIAEAPELINLSKRYREVVAQKPTIEFARQHYDYWQTRETGPKIPPVDVALLAHAAGWRGEDLVIATALGMDAEGASAPFVVNTSASTYKGYHSSTIAVGLWQMLDTPNYTEPFRDASDNLDPWTNAKGSYELWKILGWHKGWEAVSSGNYLSAMHDARTVVQKALHKIHS